MLAMTEINASSLSKRATEAATSSSLYGRISANLSVDFVIIYFTAKQKGEHFTCLHSIWLNLTSPTQFLATSNYK